MSRRRKTPAPPRPRGRPRHPDALLSRIRAFFAAHPHQSFRSHEVAEALGVAHRLAVVRPTIRRLSDDNELRRVARGLYRAPRPAGTPEPPDTITRESLLDADYNEHDARSAEDAHCVGFFQKELAGGELLNVSLWKFAGSPVQVNFEVLVKDRELAVDVGVRGVPEHWRVAELEAYVAGLVARVRRRPRRSKAHVAYET